MTDADRLRAAGSPVAYQARADDSQYHIVCRACGAVAGVDRVARHAPCLARDAGAGFAIDGAEVTFWGLCSRCRATAGGPAAPEGGRP